MEELELRWPNWLGVVAVDLQSQRRFYRDVLALPELESGKGWVQFDMGWPNLLELVQRTGERVYDQSRYQPGFAVRDIRTARSELIRRGVEPISDLEGGPEAGGLWCYFRDPERNVFELSERLGSGWPRT